MKQKWTTVYPEVEVGKDERGKAIYASALIRATAQAESALASLRAAVEALAGEWERDREECRRLADDAYRRAREGIRGAVCREHAHALRALLLPGDDEGREP